MGPGGSKACREPGGSKQPRLKEIPPESLLVEIYSPCNKLFALKSHETTVIDKAVACAGEEPEAGSRLPLCLARMALGPPKPVRDTRRERRAGDPAHRAQRPP